MGPDLDDGDHRAGCIFIETKRTRPQLKKRPACHELKYSMPVRCCQDLLAALEDRESLETPTPGTVHRCSDREQPNRGGKR